MTTILHNLGNIKEIFAKFSFLFFQQPIKGSTDIKQQDWIYRGEGNANLVISLPNRRQILRIKKTQRKSRTTLIDWLVELITDYLNQDLNEDIETATEESLDIKFYRNVMTPLMGCFVCDATLIIINRRQTEDLNKALQQCRPNYRKHKKLKFGKATFLTDFAFLPKHLDSYGLIGATYSVEIKPKQGWIANRNPLEKCKFCQNQYLKLSQGQIKKISNYCPLDLFSGEKHRMIKSIKSLITDPQNNFKIFRNGVQVYGEQSNEDNLIDLLKDWLHHNKESSSNYNLMEEFLEIIYKTLIKSIDIKRSSCIFNSNRKEMDPNCGDLPEGCILERILRVQKLDSMGISYYKELKDRMKLGNKSNYVKTLLNEIERKKDFLCVNEEENGKDFNELELTPYLIASVANDCSFMLTYRKMIDLKTSVTLDQRYILESSNGSYAVNVGVFDLYPKPISTIDKHFKRMEELSKLSSQIGM
ncbi:inositol-pentakisphosphate 2-kinase [Onthophagus taurus]|uniref:inositol-pentakisphosphate 2-kinase n=1 Tax=Onthophagus taurus TaxID=166361 RepID=UPI000C20C3C1|nr:inositol-pentakisphosphate 2-kinase [Onthophagus taurus]